MLKLKRENSKDIFTIDVEDKKNLNSLEDIIDWSQIKFEFPEEPVGNYKEDLVPIDQAEKVLGKMPNFTKPKPPSSKSPKPETISKFEDDLYTYMDYIQSLKDWYSKYDLLVALSEILKNTKDRIEDLKKEVDEWSSTNIGTFILRNGINRYSKIPDPVKLVTSLVDTLNIPDKIDSLNDKAPLDIEDIYAEEDRDILPTISITVGKDSELIISIPDDLNDITLLIEDYVETIQPKDLLSMTKAQMDQKSYLIMKEWEKEGITNSQLDPEGKELKLYLASVAFLNEIQQLNKYPLSSTVGELVNHFLKQI